ncbi:pilin N-terminal domain-containing protein, partial [Pseudolactococcus yaeyamensis]
IMWKKILFSAMLLTLATPLMAQAETTKTTNDTVAVTTTPKKSITQQKIAIHKVISQKTLESGVEIKNLAGVNGANFRVYDVTEIMWQELDTVKLQAQKKADELNAKASSAYSDKSKEAEENKTPEKASKTSTTDEKESDKQTDLTTPETPSDDDTAPKKVFTIEDIETISSDEFVTKLTSKIQKMTVTELKMFAQGATQNYNNEDGVFEFTIPVKEQEYRAYYVVNDKVADNAATLSMPFVMMTPQFDAQGVLLDVFNIYPKSEAIPKIPDTFGKKEFPNTGIKADFFSYLVNLFR